MNREIEFRGKSYKDNTWIQGYLTRDLKGHYRIQFDVKCFSVVIKENTLGQFSGLKDINGVEIYEGDIINACNDRGVIEFDCGVFGINWDYGRCDNRTTMYGTFGQRHNLRRMDDEIIDRIEIIGNIYDNPELLKTK